MVQHQKNGKFLFIWRNNQNTLDRKAPKRGASAIPNPYQTPEKKKQHTPEHRQRDSASRGSSVTRPAAAPVVLVENSDMIVPKVYSFDGVVEKTGLEIYKFPEAKELVSHVRVDLLKAPGARFSLRNFGGDTFLQSQLRSDAD